VNWAGEEGFRDRIQLQSDGRADGLIISILHVLRPSRLSGLQADATRQVDLEQPLARSRRYTGSRQRSHQHHELSAPNYSFLDRLLTQADQSLRTLVPGAAPRPAPSPAQQCPMCRMDAVERSTLLELMRITPYR